MPSLIATVEVGASSEGPFEALEVRIDDDAVHAQMPSAFLQRLGIQAYATRRFRTRDGRRVTRRLGAVWLWFDGNVRITTTIFVPGEEQPVLGRLALAELGLQLDESGQRLEPMVVYWHEHLRAVEAS